MVFMFIPARHIFMTRFPEFMEKNYLQSEIDQTNISFVIDYFGLFLSMLSLGNCSIDERALKRFSVSWTFDKDRDSSLSYSEKSLEGQI